MPTPFFLFAMFDDFKHLSLFLAKAAPEVGGRSDEDLNPDLKGRIAAFSDGKLSVEEARELSKELLVNRKAIEHLAGMLAPLPHAS